MAKKKSASSSAQQKAVQRVKADIAKAKNKLVSVERKAVAFVKKNPKKAAAIGAAIAVAVGIAAYRALRKKK